MKYINTSTYKINIRFIISGILTIMLLVSCSKKVDQPKEKILVKIGDKSISVNEFIRRAEYTVRPPYCRGDHNLDKK